VKIVEIYQMGRLKRKNERKKNKTKQQQQREDRKGERAKFLELIIPLIKPAV